MGQSERQPIGEAEALPVGTPVWWVDGIWVWECEVVSVKIWEPFTPDESPRFVGYMVTGLLASEPPEFAPRDDVFRRPQERQRVIEKLKVTARCLRGTISLGHGRCFQGVRVGSPTRREPDSGLYVGKDFGCTLHEDRDDA